MSGPSNNADSDREGFTCSALLMCLYMPGRSSKKKPEEEASTSNPQVQTGPAPDQPAKEEQEPAPQVPSRADSLEKFECASLYSGNNIVFDFAVGEGEHAASAGGTPSAVHGYCPSPCFDLPVELIRAGERYGAVADAPVTAAFVFGDYQGGALKKMASCLVADVEGGNEARPPHLVRFLSASDPSVPRPPDTPSRAAPPKGTAVDADHCEFARQPAGFPEQETAV